MADQHPKPRWNDGQGLTPGDLNRMSTLLSRIGNEQGAMASLAGSAPGFSQSETTNPYEGRHRWDLLETGLGAGPVSRILGYGRPGVRTITGGQIDFSIGHFLALQATSGSTPGTAPDGAPPFLTRSFENAEFPGALGPANPTTNPRIDALGIRLGYGTGNTTSRDFEDAATRALSSQSMDIDHNVAFEYEWATGAEVASPGAGDVPALSAGYSRLFSFNRTVGQASVTIGQVHCWAYPHRLGIETIWGNQAAFGADWTQLGLGELSKNGAGSGSIYFIPRSIHSGSRICAVAVGQDSANDFDVTLTRLTCLASGASMTATDLVNVGQGGAGVIGGGGNAGIHLAGEADWSATYGFPIWGNGFACAGWVAEHGSGLGDDASQLAIRISDTSGWAGGDRISFVRIYYLY